MAIDDYYARLLSSTINVLRKRTSKKRINIGCLSYLDILVPEIELIKLFPEINTKALIKRDDSKRILEWHGISSKFEVVETKAFF